MEQVTSPRISPHNEWFIAHNNADVVHHGYNEQGTRIETGQPFLEVTENEEDYLNRLKQLENE